MPQSAGNNADVIVVGGGPAGLTAAIALASSGVSTLLIGEPPSPTDNRTTALLAGSIAALETLGAWSRCEANAAPLRIMRLVDDTGRLLRAPEVKFDAAEIGLNAFGYNIANRQLVAALLEHAATLPNLEIRNQLVRAVNSAGDEAVVTLGNGDQFSAPLVIGADGRKSVCRETAGIDTEKHSHPQSALTLSFGHSRPHHDTSTEFHTTSGPFTLVPLPGQRSSLVWVMTPHAAETTNELSDDDLSREVEQRSQSILGRISVEPGRGLFPLSTIQARRFAARRIALVGEAAHVIPPIGAQGLNLGLRDAAAIAEIVVEAVRHGIDSGSTAVLDKYDRARRSDVGSRTVAVDLLNWSLLTDFLPVQATRGVGLYVMDRVAPLRRAVMREGVTPAAAQPRLMRGEAL